MLESAKVEYEFLDMNFDGQLRDTVKESVQISSQAISSPILASKCIFNVGPLFRTERRGLRSIINNSVAKNTQCKFGFLILLSFFFFFLLHTYFLISYPLGKNGLDLYWNPIHPTANEAFANLVRN